MGNARNWKLRISLGLVFMAGMAGLFIYGFILKNNNEPFNQILVLGIICAAAGINQLQKAVNQLKSRRD